LREKKHRKAILHGEEGIPNYGNPQRESPCWEFPWRAFPIWEFPSYDELRAAGGAGLTGGGAPKMDSVGCGWAITGSSRKSQIRIVLSCEEDTI